MISRTFLRSLPGAVRQTECTRCARTSPPLHYPRLAVPISLPKSCVRRWNSSQAQQAEAKKEEVQDAQAEIQEQPSSSTEVGARAEDDRVRKELEGKKQEVIDLTDRLKRSVAEYRNLQDQTRREIQASRDFALQRFAKDLLDSIDNLDRALATVPTEKLSGASKELVDLHGGLSMTEQILLGTLKTHGIERFDPSETSAKFDPNTMDATFQAPQKDREDGTVFHTQQKGFLLNGRVLRAAKVGVVKNS